MEVNTCRNSLLGVAVTPTPLAVWSAWDNAGQTGRIVRQVRRGRPRRDFSFHGPVASRVAAAVRSDESPRETVKR